MIKIHKIKFAIPLLTILSLLIVGCNGNDSSSNDVSSIPSNEEIPVWDPNTGVFYNASHISRFGSAVPSGVANYDNQNDEVVIWNTDASLDNYGGVQTPVLRLDFSKAVIFEMDITYAYSQYILKLSVEGEYQSFYVLADESEPGTVSINVVDSMLSQKFRNRNTQPDPGYNNPDGWWYNNQIKNCTFHILAKGPDGERQTGELILKHISVTNNQTPLTDINIHSDLLVDNTIEGLKGRPNITLSASLTPDSITDQRIIWSSSDTNTAPIDENGVLSFVNVGQALITAKSRIDQSKQHTITVNVTSGFENPTLLKNELTSLQYGGASVDLSRFTDLFNTTWGTDIIQPLNISSLLANDFHYQNNTLVIKNYFDDTNTNHINEANAVNVNNKAINNVNLVGISSSNVYRNINGKLYEKLSVNSIDVAYAELNADWNKMDTYEEKGILIANSGQVFKYHIRVLSAESVANYAPNDFLNTVFWTIPDRTRRTEDPIIHALSPASIRVDNDVLVVKQNKYPEAKYCFGGIVSNVYEVDEETTVNMLLDVVELNQKKEFVRTMWELKVLYYYSDGTTVVDSNPLKISSDNETGLFNVAFTPTYNHFRIYLVVNGSDIGEQFEDAEMKIESLKVYTTIA
jgi:hypothetical protein